MQEAAPKSAAGTTDRPQGRGSARERKQALRLFRILSVTSVVLVAAAAYGLFFDKSIRADPFAPWPGLWQWLSNNQPHPALARIPVVPIGARGALTYRPADTSWINSPYPPLDVAAALQPGPAASPAAASLGLVGAAHAQEQQSQQPVPSLESDAGLASGYMPLFNPDGAPRIVHAQCLPPAEDTRQTCWINVEDVAGLFRHVFGQAGWEQIATEGYDRPLAYFEFSRNGVNAIAIPSRAEDGLLNMVDGQFRPRLDVGKSTNVVPIQIPDPVSRHARLLKIGERIYSIAAPGPLGDEFIFDDQGIDLIFSDLFQSATGLIDFSPTRVGRRFELFYVGARGTIGRASGSEFGSVNSDTGVEAVTSADLRSVYFQDDGIGWVSSGWYDSDEEAGRPLIFQTTDSGATWAPLSYRYRPAPWTLYGALPGILFAFYGVAASYRQLRSIGSPRPGIEDIGASDQPIGWNDPDVLGLKPLARALSRFLRNRNTEPPLTIAVTGQWGSGKSSLMNLVVEDLRWAGARPVWFNAWHHQKEEHLLAALLENLRRQALPPIWRFSGLLFRVRLFARRTRKRLIGLLVLALTVALVWVVLRLFVSDADIAATYAWVGWLWSKLVPGTEVSVELPDADEILKGLFGVGAAGATIVLVAKALMQLGGFTLNPAKLMATLSENTRVKDFADQLGFRYRFADEFNDVCRAMRHGGNAGLVVMIDDLDRCQPDNVLEVLEAVNFLVSAGPCFIFLGIDKEKVISAVTQKLGGDARYAERYLEKLVNIEVSVPEATADRTATLAAPPEDETTRSPWPERIRRMLQAAPDALAPAFVAVMVLLTVLAIPAPPSEEPVTQGPQAAVEDTQGAATGGSTSTGTGSGESSGADAAAGGEAAPTVALPTVSPDALATSWPWATIVVLLFAVAAIAVAMLRRSTVEHDISVEDSADFRDALTIWHPVFFAASPTPRGIKRHQNRLRFQAMRLRPLAPERQWLDELFEGKRDDASEDGGPPTAGVDDPMLVAIGALAAYDAALGTHFLDEAAHLPTDLGRDERSREISAAVQAHVSAFPGDWPPSEAQIEAYCGLSDSIRA